MQSGDCVLRAYRVLGWAIAAVLGVGLGYSVVGAVAASSPGRAPGAMKSASLSYKPMPFAEVPGWADDDHLAAFNTFRKSCERVLASAGEAPAVAGSAKLGPPNPALVNACEAAGRIPGKITKEAARAFFEANFTPNAVTHKGPQGLLTGYYEPIMEGSRP